MRFIDLHAHFPMHTPFPPVPFANPRDAWKKPLFEGMNVTLNYELGAPRVSLERWFKDDPEFGVTGFGSVLYDPEDEFLVESGPAPIPSAIDHTRAQLANVEQEIGADARVQIVRNPKEMDRCLANRTRFLFHTLEGGLALGGDARNVETLAGLGVASITPAHLLYRGVATCENGFPPAAALLFKHELEHQPIFGLSQLGKTIVDACFKHGVIVDIAHARGDAQKDIFEIGRTGYPTRPIICSHNSVRAVSDAPLNLSDEALLAIRASRGVVGVIFYTHWLRRQHQIDLRSDLRLITDVIDHITSVTGSFDYVAIGSDLDGFIDPIRTCSNYSEMSTLSRHLAGSYGAANAERILSENARRVLHEGWTGVESRR
jgi:microsomal dipeptidase-like Zn-dependent dipeptidase